MLGRDAAFLGCDSRGQQVAEGGLVSLGIVGAYQHRNGGAAILGTPAVAVSGGPALNKNWTTLEVCNGRSA